MRIFLNDFISTLSFQQRTRVYSVLDRVRAEKSQIDIIAQRLNSQGIVPNLQLRTESAKGKISSTAVRTALVDTEHQLGVLYRTSNDIDLILSNSITVMVSDIQALEDELKQLEKSVANYGFLLSHNKSFDYAYLETYDNSLGRETTFDFLVPDRSALPFGKSDQAFISTNEGVLVLPQETARSFPLKGSIIENNVAASVTSFSSLSEALNSNSAVGWRMSTASVAPISSSLLSFDNLYSDVSFIGACVVLELHLAAPSPCDSIKLTPFADTGLQLAQVEIFEDNDETNKRSLLNAPITLNSDRSVFFDAQSVAKIKIYLCQPTYSRNGLNPVISEQRYRRSLEHFNPLNDLNYSESTIFEQRRKIKVSFLSRLVQKYLHNKLGTSYNIELPRRIYSPELQELKDEWRALFNYHRHPKTAWNNSTWKSSLVQQMIAKKLPKELVAAFMPKVLQNSSSSRLNVYPYDPIFSGPSTGRVFDSQEFKYEYTIGLQNISIGTTTTSSRGVFVSSVLPSAGDVAGVMIKSDEEHFNDVTYDQSQLTSVEYSVTNKAVPDAESDWISILPIDTKRVIGERLFIDQVGNGYFRFSADPQSIINLFKNGNIVTDIDFNQSLIHSEIGQTIIGIQLPVGYASRLEILTVSYTTAVDSTFVDFSAAGFEIPPLVSSYDSDGAGEGFSGSNGQLVIELKRKPYIDYAQVDDSTYIDNYGLDNYNPIIIILNDGTTALNFTNYKGGTQSILNPDSALSFIHNHSSIMFNKAVAQNFRVFYQHLPNNTRFRVVLRSNSLNVVSPKVSATQVKAKTRMPDPRRN